MTQHLDIAVLCMGTTDFMLKIMGTYVLSTGCRGSYDVIRSLIAPDCPKFVAKKASNSGSARDKPAVAGPRFRIPVRSLMSPAQLEVKCVADEAWYNADVEILDQGILVRYDGFDEDDEFWDIAYLRKHAGHVQDVIRLSSSQLQDEQCRSVKEGMVVCARGVLENDDEEEDGEKEEEVKYFDARIVNVARNPHTFDEEEERCTCVFEAYWITGPHKKEFGSPYNSVFFTCADICLLNPEHVVSHPVVQNLLHMVGISSQVLSDHSEKSHPSTSFTGPSRSREASSKEDKPLDSEQSGNPDLESVLQEGKRKRFPKPYAVRDAVPGMRIRGCRAARVPERRKVEKPAAELEMLHPVTVLSDSESDEAEVEEDTWPSSGQSSSG
ncbi:hypothetical protein MPTK1_4g01400 [Marchantia polymorpha subsp. ruderalis]|uniref:SAWADEE domain-containing protein n=2 Tax=Marchantia polymorpha TaxID=3197 RepID=A0AAF6B560_MARPO|nr:hypothetical protein MARPO_0066s0003 [Marchantia polymorpha]BBN07144.1 hypothetical protein Mp_4g01400 [Marchantia polymorpha subsp. ruderalis]|eukprot:PTQ36040.1 hypothetical protein MARPO_0066s0003 [Marchantia polymorpha]